MKNEKRPFASGKPDAWYDTLEAAWPFFAANVSGLPRAEAEAMIYDVVVDLIDQTKADPSRVDKAMVDEAFAKLNRRGSTSPGER